jgi:hypothetical protein
MNPQPRYQPDDKIGGRYQVHRALMRVLKKLLIGKGVIR